MSEAQTKPPGSTRDGPGAGNPTEEIPEVFQMPPAPTVRVLGRIRKVGPAPLIFVDDAADETSSDA